MNPPFQEAGDVAHAALTREGLAAARDVAVARGLPDGDARVLSARGNLVVHLVPAVLAASAGEHAGPCALAASAAASGTAVPDAATLAPFAAARRVEAAAWTVAMAAVHPSRYARLVDPALRAVPRLRRHGGLP